MDVPHSRPLIYGRPELRLKFFLIVVTAQIVSLFSQTMPEAPLPEALSLPKCPGPAVYPSGVYLQIGVQ